MNTVGTCIIEPGRAKDAINGRSRVKRVQEPEQLAPCARPNRIAGSSGSPGKAVWHCCRNGTRFAGILNRRHLPYFPLLVLAEANICHSGLRNERTDHTDRPHFARHYNKRILDDW